ncbi:hypothetical protein AB0O07_10900 [Streptomyces sp. NPDC093085]|uniref:hypothetical protein n=1 Tax=Streptomyces sp. NPDC093085 TaxID=3155068 RepID=UPI003414B486
MRLRPTLAAAVGALTLLVALPGQASAAEGTFSYVYHDLEGDQRVGRLVDPESRECITLREAAWEFVPPAHTPRNMTNSSATVFTDVDCEGDHYTLRIGGLGSERLKLRSVVFS